MIDNVSNAAFASTALQRPASPSPTSPRAAEQATGTGNAAQAAQGLPLPAAASPPTDRTTLQDAVQKVQDFLSGMASELKFSIDDDTGIQVVKIIDNTTQEVIRQMPSEEMLAVAKALDTIKGLFIKNTA